MKTIKLEITTGVELTQNQIDNLKKLLESAVLLTYPRTKGERAHPEPPVVDVPKN
jgi:hypothetical protein